MSSITDIQQLPYHLELLKNLVVRDVKVKYQRSALGFLWTLLNPLFVATIYVFVFSNIMRFGVSGYWAFLLSGFFAWNFFSMTITSGSDVIFANRSIITRVAFPHEILVISITLAKLIEFVCELFIVIFLVGGFYLHRLPGSLLALPLVITIQFLMTLGLVFPLACLRVFYKDVEQVLPIAMTGWFFLTPVVYMPEMMPKQYSFILALNPMTGIITAYHDIFYHARFPDPQALLRTGLIALAVFLAGYWIFTRVKKVFAEVV